MAGEWNTERYPQFAEPLRRLTEQRQELEDEPLHLAVAYAPGSSRDPQDIFLFEVIGGWEGGVSPNRELFETTFEPNARLQTGFDQRLHLILTTPVEMERALEDCWPSAEEIVGVFRQNQFKVLHCDEIGRRVLERIEAAARRVEVVRG